jgi:hypothetical protein
MTSPRGSLKLGSEVIVQDLQVTIKLSTSKAGVKLWRGSFTVTGQMRFTANQTYLLVMEDGRSGPVEIAHTTHSGGATLVEFHSTGRFG